ncbi:hypothetical protein AVEN_123037-1 [Araneus ventricosus]|uniref:Uncharacterized protein n=1 Tax=Araneus ventricosus TaxID=182803 RepID=A0A4Y2KCN9_ARAVE|nr:hypothetical protein AVEN_123037-1 [Araneus ventricosus]
MPRRVSAHRRPRQGPTREPSRRQNELQPSRPCEDSRTAAQISPAKVATWMVGKTPKENSPKELLFTPYLVTLGSQNLFGNSQLRRSG